MANEAVANYYDLANKTESGFRFRRRFRTAALNSAACLRSPRSWQDYRTDANRTR